jgi:ethanolamine ammonia-lyase large subunit
LAAEKAARWRPPTAHLCLRPKHRQLAAVRPQAAASHVFSSVIGGKEAKMDFGINVIRMCNRALQNAPSAASDGCYILLAADHV